MLFGVVYEMAFAFKSKAKCRNPDEHMFFAM